MSTLQAPEKPLWKARMVERPRYEEDPGNHRIPVSDRERITKLQAVVSEEGRATPAERSHAQYAIRRILQKHGVSEVGPSPSSWWEKRKTMTVALLQDDLRREGDLLGACVSAKIPKLDRDWIAALQRKADNRPLAERISLQKTVLTMFQNYNVKEVR